MKKEFTIFRIFLCFLITRVCGRNSRVDDPMRKLVEKWNYTLEVHEIATKDGYLLGMHRIKVSHPTKNISSLPPVLIMHGLLGSSTDWVVTGQNRSIAFLLADEGFDVWLGNNRGNTFSKGHKEMNTSNFEYWNFSWHEFGIYDTPAMIDHVLGTTDHKKLLYIGFSQGCTQFYVMCSLKPEYNDKVLLATGFAPAAFTRHIEGILRPITKLVRIARIASEFTIYFEFLPHTKFFAKVLSFICRENSPLHHLCQLIIFFTVGFAEPEEFDTENFPEYIDHAPAGCSTKQLLHYGMGAMSGRFSQYDYGIFKNLQKYQTILPPDYDLSKVKVPVALFNGLNDYLADILDVAQLSAKLPNVVSMHTVKLTKLNHLDFLYGKDIRELVYIKALKQMMLYVD